MASGKTTTFKLDKRTVDVVRDIGKESGAENLHAALRDGLRVAWLIVQYRKLGGTTLTLPEYLNLMGRLF